MKRDVEEDWKLLCSGSPHDPQMLEKEEVMLFLFPTLWTINSLGAFLFLISVTIHLSVVQLFVTGSKNLEASAAVCGTRPTTSIFCLSGSVSLTVRCEEDLN